MKELRFFPGGARRIPVVGLRAALALAVAVGCGRLASGKDVTLTFTAAGTLSEKGVWTVGGQPGSQADLAAGDTLIVATGSLTGNVAFEDFETPRLAVFRYAGTGAVNLLNLKLNLQDGGALDVPQGRLILNTGCFLNSGDGEGAMKTVVRTGSGTLQIRVAQPGCFKFRLSAGCNLYLHDGAALGPAYSTTVADALVLEDGAVLRSGYSNTADRDVTLPSSHGVTLADGATVTFAAVRGDTAENNWSLAVAGPIRGTGVTLKIDGGGAAGQGVALCGDNAFSGTLAFGKTLRLASDHAVSKDVALVSEAADAVLELDGRVVTARSLDVAKGFGGVRGPGVLKLDGAFADLPDVPCADGAALAAADGREQPGGGTIDVAAGTARAVTAAADTVTKTGGGALHLSGSTAALSSLSVQAGTVALEGLDATPAAVTVADGATLRAYGGASIYEFRFSRTVGANSPVCLSEIALTCGGVPLDAALYADVQVSDGSTNAWNLVDGTGKTFWTSGVRLGGASAVTVRLVLARPVVVDGYLLGTGEAEDGATNPADWTFAARRLDGETILDQRTGVELARYPGGDLSRFKRGNFAPRFALAEPAALASVASATTVTLAEGATCELVGGEATLGALSGAGTLLLSGGARLTVNDLTGWMGAVRTADATATLALGADGVVKTPEAANLVLTADGAQSVILDASAGETPLRGRLAGAAGLVKTGAGTAWLCTEQATATGAVSVVAGRCCVSARRAVSHARPCTARYIRFQPLASVGRSAIYNWELGEFELVDASGARLAWPAGTTVTPQYADGLVGGANLINGSYEDRVCSKGDAGASFDDLQYVTIDTQTGVLVRGLCGLSALQRRQHGLLSGRPQAHGEVLARARLRRRRAVRRLRRERLRSVDSPGNVGGVRRRVADSDRAIRQSAPDGRTGRDDAAGGIPGCGGRSAGDVRLGAAGALFPLRAVRAAGRRLPAGRRLRHRHRRVRPLPKRGAHRVGGRDGDERCGLLQGRRAGRRRQRLREPELCPRESLCAYDRRRARRGVRRLRLPQRQRQRRARADKLEAPRLHRRRDVARG